MTLKRVTDARKAYREYLRRTANRPIVATGNFQGRLPCRHSCIKVIVPEELTREQIENMMEPESACAWVAGSALRPQMFQELCRLALLGLERTPTPAPSADTVGKVREALVALLDACGSVDHISDDTIEVTFEEHQAAYNRYEGAKIKASAALRLLSEEGQ